MKGMFSPRIVIAHLAVLALVGALVAGAVVFGGLYNVSARLGHLPGVSWVLHTTYRNSVDLYAPSESTIPFDLNDPGRVALGAGHFDQACRFCHAAPGETQTATAQAMNPRPPHIEEAVAHWQPNHLFWIVDEGVKMSGMPQWPTAGRDDDVWSVVAFLTAVRGGMSNTEYETLLGRSPAASANSESWPEAAAPCVTCHGADGVGRGGQYVPRLDIQGAEYLAASLLAYRQDTRQSGFMAHAASVPTEEQLRELAQWYGEMPAANVPNPGDADPELLQYGRTIAYGRDEKRNVPACVSCHGGDEGGPKGPIFPALAGQYKAYLAEQLHAFRAKLRGGTDRATLMNHAAHDLTDTQIDALAAWYAALPARKN